MSFQIHWDNEGRVSKPYTLEVLRGSGACDVAALLPRHEKAQVGKRIYFNLVNYAVRIA